MQRACKLEQAKEIVFVDTTSSCDNTRSSLTFLLTESTAGALPLGAIITQGQSEPEFEVGFQLLQKLMGPKAFCGFDSPRVFMKDDCQQLAQALSAVWPDSNQRLCRFHILQVINRTFEKRFFLRSS